MNNFYTGIGSRKTPADVLSEMEELAATLGTAGYVLRSGGADGADSAFEAGAFRVSAETEIYLPWRGFNGNQSSLFGVCERARALAATVHPQWDYLGEGPRKLHSRNCYQVLGKSLQVPSAFVVCWTPDGCECRSERRSGTGGTATAIVLASEAAIPVFNLQKAGARSRLRQHLETLGVRVSIQEKSWSQAQSQLF